MHCLCMVSEHAMFLVFKTVFCVICQSVHVVKSTVKGNSVLSSSFLSFEHSELDGKYSLSSCSHWYACMCACCIMWYIGYWGSPQEF